GLIIAALKDELRKLKGKALDNNVVTTHTIALKMLKIDVEPLAPRLLNNRTAHSNYLRITQEQPVILRKVVEQGKSQNPLNNSLDISYYEMVGISHETSVARSPQQNGVVEGRNHRLIKAVRTILEPTLHEMTHATISSGPVPNPPLSTPFVPPTTTDWDLLFQPMFDELLNLPPSVDPPTPKVIAPIAEVVAPEPAASTGSPSSTTVDQDAPSPSNSKTSPETQSLVISNDVEERNHNLNVVHLNNDPFLGILILKNNFDSSSSDVIPTVVHTAAPNSEHVNK
nr:hypothetical protein [Tanacetum cinerariifolium]